MTESIGFEVHLDLPYDQALDQVTSALKEEGFGVLTRIDVRATMQEKLGKEFRPYAILGACNPPLAFRALSGDPQSGLLLPCNVTVESDPAGGTTVRIVNPEAMLAIGKLTENPELAAVASQARERLERVARALSAR